MIDGYADFKVDLSAELSKFKGLINLPGGYKEEQKGRRNKKLRTGRNKTQRNGRCE
jgi:hypothetical protein